MKRNKAAVVGSLAPDAALLLGEPTAAVSSSRLLAERQPRVPLYAKVLEALRQDLAAGVWQPGDQMPTEPELMARFGVSRITVRQALMELVHAGALYRRSGKGTFVTQPKIEQELHALTGFVEDMMALGLRASARVVSVARVPADATVAQHLEVPRGSAVLRIERVRLGNEEPLSFDVTYLPPALGERVAREDLTLHPIFTLLEDKYGIPLGYADYRIHAATADSHVARQLDIARGAPTLVIERMTYSESGTPLDYERLYYRGDRISYRMRLLRRSQGQAAAPAAAAPADARPAD
ncbi:MAG: Transcriptional regulator, GntR family [uncultured Chloroflexi bacterium]|uniref:Transcriptional regulator, GntR family n=1 Tax=uncultured Chloroflexota bacterium TaxID=166587 RepID=A0A6J4I4E0_9CHLR|nr:MAG: Transcriptional regulator, GntR family [uncultured Chloroflexota bacterium]